MRHERHGSPGDREWYTQRMLKLENLLIVFVIACGSSPKPATPPVQPEPQPPQAEQSPVAEPQQPAPPAEPPPPAKPAPAKPVMSIAKDGGLATPESVLYDAADDVYLISNINGGPSAKDGNGFISKVSPDGTITALKWIDGTKKGSTLNAPKGMALVGDVLYVADLDTVRMFDRKTGKGKGEIPLKGATFANDVAAGPDGKLYVTDTGIKIDDKGVTPTKTDAVWVIEKKKPHQLAKGEDLGKPNGVFATEAGVWVATFGSGEIYMLDAKGARTAVVKPPAGQLDGLYVDGDTIWVTSWEGGAIYKGTKDGGFTPVISELTAPADFGIDTKRKLVLIPGFNDNTVAAYGDRL